MDLGENRQRMEKVARRPLRVLRGCRAQRMLAWCRRREGIAGAEDGATLIEFALVTTAMMSFIFVVMQVCLAFYSAGMINEVARETTRWAMTRGSTCQTASLTSCTTTKAAIGTYAKGLGYPNVGGGTMVVTTTFPDLVPVTNAVDCQVPSVCRVKVAITYTVPITLPLVPKNSIALSASSEMYFVQ